MKRRALFGREEIASHIAHLEGISHEQASRITKNVINAIILGLANGYTVNLNGLMRLTGEYVKPRQGYHPLERCPMEVPARVRVRTSFSQVLRNLLKGKVELFEKLASEEEQLPDPKELVKKMNEDAEARTI